jgi:Domain of unknown function (DUF397)
MESNWRKSSYSGSNGGECVEVASAEAVLVRDTADRNGPVLTLTAGAWRAFTAAIVAIHVGSALAGERVERHDNVSENVTTHEIFSVASPDVSSTEIEACFQPAGPNRRPRRWLMQRSSITYVQEAAARRAPSAAQ